MAFPTTPILDSFNRANEGPPPSTNWTTGIAVGFGGFSEPGHEVIGNELANTFNDVAQNYWNVGQFGPDCEAYITVTNATGLISAELAARLTNIGQFTCDGYVVQAQPAGGEGGPNRVYTIYRIDDGLLTMLDFVGESGVGSMTGDRYGIQIIGSVIYLWGDTGDGWEIKLTANDSTHTTAGFIGVVTEIGSQSRLDDFGGGVFVPEGGVSVFNFRNLPFFDDEEVNRFEFWPAVTEGGAVHERSAAVNASASIESSGQFFSVFETSVAVSATADISSAGDIDYHRAAALNASGAITTSGHGILERSAGLSATADIASSAQFYSILERASVFNATASIAVAGQTAHLRSAAINGTALITSSGFRIGAEIERSAAIDAVGLISSAGQITSAHQRAAAFNASGSIESSASFFSILERSSLTNADGLIQISANKETSRSVSVSCSGEIATGRLVVSQRAVVINATGLISVAGLGETLIIVGALNVNALNDGQLTSTISVGSLSGTIN